MGVLRVNVIVPSALNKVRLTWSEPANATDAAVSGNYTVDGGVGVSAAAVVAQTNNTQVELTLTGLVLGTTYKVTVANVRDIASSTAIISPNEQGKFIWREIGDNNLNGVVEQGGMLFHQVRPLYGDQLLGYNVLGTVDLNPPLVFNVTPTNLSNITPATVIGFDVTDESVLRRIIIKLFYADGTWDLVWDGDSFGPKFQGGSNVHSLITQGHRFRILRDGGWQIGVGVNLTPYAIDVDGNENI